MEDLYQLYKKHPNVCTDSREITTGCLFFALKGERFDGNTFALQAIEKGAAYAIIDDPNLCKHPRLIFVQDVLKALQNLAAIHRKTLNIPFVAITGTNGKTTTKELTAQVLAARYKVGVTKGNRNNHIGVPLTLLQMDVTTEIAVVEMGANHPGEIAALCHIVAPTHGLITNIGKGHLEGFGSLEGVQKTKGELYDFLTAHNGTVFYNADNPMLREMVTIREIKEAIPYGINTNNVHLSATGADPFLRLAMPDWPAVDTHLIGAYNADNVLAALTLGNYFKVEKTVAVTALINYIPANNRSQLICSAYNTVIMDAYNANPSSMRVAIDNFAQFEGENKCLILGDMLELGAESGKEHKAIVDLLAEKQLTNAWLVGNHFRQAANEGIRCFDTVDEVIAFLTEYPLKNSTLLIKGSHSTGLDQLKNYV